MNRPEFDRYSPSYEELLKDPIRDRFATMGSKFFHERKRDLIRAQFRSIQVDTAPLSYLDLGCGKGELASLLSHDFRRVAGCDPSAGMLSFAEGVETRVQDDVRKIPFADGEFDFVTAVCVYHHVPPAARLALCQEVSRVLKPSGIFAIIEHNPYNPVTRKIVNRTPVDADAVLLKAGETTHWLRKAGFKPRPAQYFLYFPESIYRRGGQLMEGLLHALPLGGQYAIFATK
jgi:SAM-dependent methyltransferase